MDAALRKCLPGGSFGRVTRKRSLAMGAVRSRNNKTTERRLRAALAQAGIRGWVLHPLTVEGCPDFYFPSIRVAVFVDGCFWHGCAKCGHVPKTRSQFWAAKIARNQKRDARTNRRLREDGIRVMRLWEHELASGASGCIARIRRLVVGRSPSRHRAVQ